MSNRRPLTRGDLRRNDKLTRLRSIVRSDLAIVGIDLASAKQAAVVADHDSITLGRKMFDGDPWVIEEIIDWALPIALGAGFAGIVGWAANRPGTAGSRCWRVAGLGPWRWCA